MSNQDITFSNEEIEGLLQLKVGDIVQVSNNGALCVPLSIYLWEDGTFHSTPEFMEVSEAEFFYEKVEESEVNFE